MKTYYLFSLFFVFFSISLAQEKSTKYVFFDSNSSEICKIPESQQGRYHGTTSIKRYIKTMKKDETIDFYICNELFSLNKKTNIDTCSTDYLKTIKLSKIEDLIIRVNKENPLYPDQVFEKIYIIEQINDSTLLKYNVKWQYYIE